MEPFSSFSARAPIVVRRSLCRRFVNQIAQDKFNIFV
jgi:hypothetical protein